MRLRFIPVLFTLRRLGVPVCLIVEQNLAQRGGRSSCAASPSSIARCFLVGDLQLYMKCVTTSVLFSDPVEPQEKPILIDLLRNFRNV